MRSCHIRLSSSSMSMSSSDSSSTGSAPAGQLSGLGSTRSPSPEKKKKIQSHPETERKREGERDLPSSILYPIPNSTPNPTPSKLPSLFHSLFVSNPGATMRGKAPSLVCLILLVSSVFVPKSLAEEEPNRRYKAIFNFGDSLVDAGNLIQDGVPDFLATAKSPYGMTFFGKPTGRCSDGRLVIDFICQEFGIPLLPPSKAHNTTFKYGANFAITGATALDTEFFEKLGLGATVWNSGSLHTQIKWFQDLKPSLCGTPEECKALFSRSLFILGEFGGNDYNAPLFASRKFKEVYGMMPHVMKSISDGVEKLIAEGAVDIVVPGVLPVGCFPVYLSLSVSMFKIKKEGFGVRSGCMKKFNTLAWVHNSLLRQTIAELRVKYPAARIIYADYYSPAIQFILHPEKFGFDKQIPRACCGAPGEGVYNFNMTAKCGEVGATACPDPSTHWSWDGIHLTEAAYGHIARGWLNGNFAEPAIIPTESSSR